MFCPLLPKVSCTALDVDKLVRLAVECGVEEIFAEPVNPRGPGLRLTQEALDHHHHWDALCGVMPIRRKVEWSWYVVKLFRLLQRNVRKYYDIERLRFLLYPSKLIPEKLEDIRRDDAGVIWLGRQPVQGNGKVKATPSRFTKRGQNPVSRLSAATYELPGDDERPF